MTKLQRTTSKPRATRTPAVRARTRKISITVDAAVLDEVKRLLRQSGSNLSAYISETLAQDLRDRHLRSLIEAHEAEHGGITEAELAEVRAKWQG